MNGRLALPALGVRESSRDKRARSWASSARLTWMALVVSVLAAFLAGPANAAVSLRVEARPVSDPIQAFVTVTDAAGTPVGGLTAADFTVLVDGAVVSGPTFSLPPTQDANQRVSVVFTMDYSGSVTGTALLAMEDAVIEFITQMKPGDYAAIVKFNNTNPSKASVVQGFTQIDGPTGTGTSALLSAVKTPYPGVGTNLYNAVVLSIQQFASPPTPLPNGPKAVIVVSDGGENSSTGINFDTVIATANQASIPVFTIGVGGISGGGTPLTIMTQSAAQTGGQYLAAPTEQQIDEAYVKISSLLNNEYLLTFTSPITDCSSHTIEVRVKDQAAPGTATFTRCTSTSVTPPPSGGGSGGGGGGGGGSTGLLEFIAGVSLLALRRRRRRA